MTSHWMRSTPAASRSATSSPRRAKSAGRTDGTIWTGLAGGRMLVTVACSVTHVLDSGRRAPGVSCASLRVRSPRLTPKVDCMGEIPVDRSVSPTPRRPSPCGCSSSTTTRSCSRAWRPCWPPRASRVEIVGATTNGRGRPRAGRRAASPTSSCSTSASRGPAGSTCAQELVERHPGAQGRLLHRLRRRAVPLPGPAGRRRRGSCSRPPPAPSWPTTSTG